MVGVRVRIDKRQLLLDGAFAVFARRGYAQACVQEIADEAGVAKPTVYSYFSDKASLFQESLRATARDALAAQVAALEPLVDPVDDLSATLTGVGRELVLAYCDERPAALRRLMAAEIIQQPELLDILQDSGLPRLHQTLAGSFARLMVAGRLRSTDPLRAAEQFVALLLGPAEARCLMGTRQLHDAAAREIAQAAAATFLLAMAPTGEETRT